MLLGIGVFTVLDVLSKPKIYVKEAGDVFCVMEGGFWFPFCCGDAVCNRPCSLSFKHRRHALQGSCLVACACSGGEDGWGWLLKGCEWSSRRLRVLLVVH